MLPEGAKFYRQREFLGLYPYVEVTEELILKIVRPNVVGANGVTIFEAPNFGRSMRGELVRTTLCALVLLGTQTGSFSYDEMIPHLKYKP